MTTETKISLDALQRRCRELINRTGKFSSESEIDELLAEHKGKEVKLYQSLCEETGEEYVPVRVVGVTFLYKMGFKLGSGGFASVRQCTSRDTGKAFAIKHISKWRLSKDDMKILKKEVSMMRLSVGHESIVRLHDVFDQSTRLSLILDLCEGGELFDRIVELGHLTEKKAAECFIQLVSALAFLHERHIVHRDLKPENLLFSTRGGWDLKLVDFGLADTCEPDLLTDPCGTPNYVAPEILRRKPYGTTVDMWGAGVLLYILLAGFPPFYDPNDDMKKLYRQIMRAKFDMPSPYFDSVSDGAKDLINKLLVAKPEDRLTAEGALAHPWLSGEAPDTHAHGDHGLKNLKLFQYVRKLRRGVRAAIAVIKLIGPHHVMADIK